MSIAGVAGAPRIAILSTPRSGNMWLRRLLGAVWKLEDISADTPGEVDWKHLPDACALQLHWPPTDELVSRLDEGAFTTIVLARHPLDVLLSILQFAQHEPRTARWLNAAKGTELPLIGAAPSSAAFLDYARGPRAHALLGVTPAWWTSARLDGRVRFEELVDAPRRTFSALLASLGAEIDSAEVERSVAATTFESLRAETANGHFWRGRPGHWRRLITGEAARSIAEANPALFETLGYAVDADAGLTEDKARQHWDDLQSGAGARRLDARPSEAQVDAYRRPALDAEATVRDTYSLLLRREPDAGGGALAVDRLRRGLVSPATLALELLQSAEGRRLHALDDAIAFARWAREAGERPRGLRSPPQLDESAVAVPWALARYRGEGRVLDIGSAFAHPAYLAALTTLGPRVAAADPAGVESTHLDGVRADVRRLPFRDRAFDVVFCLSTLQHVGRDNRAYGLDAEDDPDGALNALRELRRVVARDGRVLVSVPCGEEQHLGMFVQHSRAAWEQLFARSDFFVFELELYEQTPAGWAATASHRSDLRYGERGVGAACVLCAELRPGRKGQSARRTARRIFKRLLGRLGILPRCALPSPSSP